MQRAEKLFVSYKVYLSNGESAKNYTHLDFWIICYEETAVKIASFESLPDFF